MPSFVSVVATIIALAAAFVAFMQWQTALQKVAVDALEERLNIYENIIAIVAEFSGSAQFPIDLHRLKWR
jgi:uncharacterized membrane protein YccC